jgi:hypothetical protein
MTGHHSPAHGPARADGPQSRHHQPGDQPWRQDAAPKHPGRRDARRPTPDTAAPQNNPNYTSHPERLRLGPPRQVRGLVGTVRVGFTLATVAWLREVTAVARLTGSLLVTVNDMLP